MKVFFGWALMAVGGIIALTCGLCTAGVAVLGASSTGSSPNATAVMQLVKIALIFGLPPIGIGVALFIAGLQLIRGPRSAGASDRGG